MNNRLLLIVLFLVGVPAVVTLFLLNNGGKQGVVAGQQPGCTLKGTVRDEGNRPVWEAHVSAFAITADAPPRLLVEATTKNDGTYELTLPPISGHYELRYLATERIELRLPYSMGAPPAGMAAVPATDVALNMDVTLKAGAQLVIEILRADGRPAGSGRYELSTAPAGGLLAGFGGQPVSREATFEGGTFTVDSLPPSQVRVYVTLATGERIDSQLLLVPGKNRHQVEL